MIGLPTIAFLGAEDGDGGGARIHVETKASLVGCQTCGVLVRVKDRSAVGLVDLVLFGRPTRLVWHKRRWVCPDGDCEMGSWTEHDDRLASPRQVLTSRAARWTTVQVGRHARSVNEVAGELGCDWHTVNDTVVAYGEALLEADTERIGAVGALGLDEVLMVRVGPYHRQHFSTLIVDVGAGQLLDVVPGRGSAEPMAWLAERTPAFLERIEFGTLDLSAPYRRVFEIMVPDATLVADPFHVMLDVRQTGGSPMAKKQGTGYLGTATALRGAAKRHGADPLPTRVPHMFIDHGCPKVAPNRISHRQSEDAVERRSITPDVKRRGVR